MIVTNRSIFSFVLKILIFSKGRNHRFPSKVIKESYDSKKRKRRESVDRLNMHRRMMIPRVVVPRRYNNLNRNAAVCYLEFEPNSVKIKRERVREKKGRREADIDTILAQCFPTFQDIQIIIAIFFI